MVSRGGGSKELTGMQTRRIYTCTSKIIKISNTTKPLSIFVRLERTQYDTAQNQNQN